MFRPYGPLSFKSHAAAAFQTSSDDDGAWEAERQILHDEKEEQRNKCAELEEALSQTQDQSATQVLKARYAITASKLQVEELREALDAREGHIDKLRMDKGALLRRAIEAEEREARLQERVELLQCGQPRPPAGASSGRRNPPASSSTGVPSPDEGDAAAPGPSQHASGATRTPRERAEWYARTRWSDEDEELLVNLIAQVGPRNSRPRYSKLAKIWNEEFPNRPPRDEGQLKYKAWNITAKCLM